MLLRIAACSYEGSLFGWDIEQSTRQSTEGDEVYLKVSLGFAFSTNNNSNITGSCLKAICVSGGGKYLVCGGQDERIKVFNVVGMRAMGDISSFAHSGAITCMEFYGDSYLITGSEDSTMCIWRTRDWQCVHILGGHKAGINGMSIHPSGKMALSVSKDGTMKLWNLVQGRCAFTRRLRGAAQNVEWHSSGNYYVLTALKEWQLFSASDNSIVAGGLHESRINKLVFASVGDMDSSSSVEDDANGHHRVAVITEDKKLSIFDFKGNQVASIDLSAAVGAGRPRDMCSHSSSLKGDILAVVTSLGKLLILSARELETLAVNNIENNDDNEVGNEKAALDKALLGSYELKGEPRLIATTIWNATISKDLARKAENSKWLESTIDSTEKQVDEEVTTSPSLTVKPKTKKNKRDSKPSESSPSQIDSSRNSIKESSDNDFIETNEEVAIHSRKNTKQKKQKIEKRKANSDRDSNKKVKFSPL